MITQTAKAYKPLVTRELLTIAAAHGTGLDTRGLRHLPAAEAQAIVKAQAFRIAPLHVSGNLWMVASASHPGTAHQVRIWGERVTCDCPGFYGHKHCWHATLVAHELHVAALGLNAHPEAAAKAAPVAPAAPIVKLQDLYA